MIPNTRRLLVPGALAALVVALDVSVWPPSGPGRVPAAASRALEAAIAEIEAGRRTTPLIGAPAAGGDVTVTFLARAEGGRAPRIVSDVTGWGEHADGTFDFTVGTMTRVGASDWYSLQASVARRARIEYLIAYDAGDYRLDPHNPRHVSNPRASELVTPGYEPPPELTGPPASPAGRLEAITVRSRAFDGTCRLFVYTPPGYRDDGDDGVAVFHDFSAARARQVPRVLDWLIDRRAIPPIVAVLVDLQSRDTSRLGAPARAFLAGELPAWLSAHYGVTRSPDRRAVIGISFGAKDALDTALGPSGAYGRLGLLIPGRRIGTADIDTIAARSVSPLRVAIVAGRYDRANVETARALRRALADAGHAVDYVEVPEGHSPRTWLHHLRDLLAGLFGRTSAERR